MTELGNLGSLAKLQVLFERGVTMPDPERGPHPCRVVCWEAYPKIPPYWAILLRYFANLDSVHQIWVWLNLEWAAICDAEVAIRCCNACGGPKDGTFAFWSRSAVCQKSPKPWFSIRNLCISIIIIAIRMIMITAIYDTGSTDILIIICKWYICKNLLIPRVSKTSEIRWMPTSCASLKWRI